MPELDIHLRLAALEADVAAIRNLIVSQYGNVLPPSRIDHPAIVNPPPAAAAVESLPEPVPTAGD